MSKRICSALIAVFLALTVAVSAISIPVLLASQRLLLNASVSIKFPTVEEQIEELGGMGFKLEFDENNTPVLATTSNSSETLGRDSMQKRHKELIDKGILRYAIYNGTLCQQSQQSQTGLQLIVILDFTDYNIGIFEEGFLKALTYVILGSGQLGNVGSNFEETNGEGGALTLYDSTKNGAVIDKEVKLTLRGFVGNNSTYIQEKTGEVSGEPQYGGQQYINHYSIRLILPGNQSNPVTLKAGSLTLEGVGGFFGNLFKPEQPDCIGIGISHIGISAENHSSVVKIEKGVAECSHFHWMTVTESQKGFSFHRTLDNILNPDLGQGYADEIFKKPHANSDFAHLYISSEKTGAASAKINIYDMPVGEIHESATDLAAAVRLLYWYNGYLKYYNLESMDIKFYHYRRTANNQIEDTPGELRYDKAAATEISGETCYPVYCFHSGAETLIGYFSVSGKLYDAKGNPVEAESLSETTA